MPMIVGAPRILVKMREGPTNGRLALGTGGVDFRIERLFHSIGRRVTLGAAEGAVWHLITPTMALDGANPWDLCHQLLQDGLGVAGAPVPEFAEPDFQQQWLVPKQAETRLALQSVCTREDQDSDFPTEPNPYWFRDRDHAQFDAAVAAMDEAGGVVRVAHLDTGYDPQHCTLPAYLETGLQRNFVDADRPDDATDDSEGFFNNLGHGTGTLGLLAGKGLPAGTAIGCVPFARVVPVRVANRVVLFENSAIARALDYVHGLCASPETGVQAVTMSMGGLASQAWAEAVNALYEAGVFIVTAAGNNFGNLPTRNIVFPARFNRVVAACGVMANHSPYADLDPSEMAGNYGPPSKMRTAIAAFTPNVPWAKFGCSGLVNFDGAGTSAATPQVAAAAAIWMQQNRAKLASYPEGWMRVEAVRKALFDSARKSDPDHFGCGELRVDEALHQTPADEADLQREPPDSACFPILRTLFGLGVAPDETRQGMLELEALQLSQSAGIEQLLPDPADSGRYTTTKLMEIADALATHPRASEALRDAIHAATPQRVPAPAPARRVDSMQKLHLQHATHPEAPQPIKRRLRVYAYDPLIGTHLETWEVNETALDVLWEADLRPGPVGQYLEVIDVDPSSQCAYAPVDLNLPELLAQDGLPPSEANPQFHQQMAYAVAMKTIEHFERALGRVALWAPRTVRDRQGRVARQEFVQRIRIYPHALRAANAYYSPDRKALLFGYFKASAADSVDVLPGGLVFGALSHDVVAHETTHALLDGLHRRFSEATNPDVLAFHEAFADIVALFQHFGLPEALRQQIAKTRGDLTHENLLAELAVEFGHATGTYGALRDAIGEVRDGRWQLHTPSRGDYQAATEPHARGAVLVAAVFNAFLQIYAARGRDFVRLATGGSGVLPPGELPSDLVERLAREASKVAHQVLSICIRALDYCPAVDITFGEYLRALITADRDLVPEDKRTYRLAFVSAFRDRGIYPADVKSLSVGSLIWEPPPLPLAKVGEILKRMWIDWDLTATRQKAYDDSRRNAALMHNWLMTPDQVSDDEIGALGLFRLRAPTRYQIGGVPGELRPFEVHSVRPARRAGPDGQLLSDLVVEITQTFRPDNRPGSRFRGGCTLLIDLKQNKARYLVRKRVDAASRLTAQQAFTDELTDDLRATYFLDPEHGVEPFALLHRLY